MTFENLPHSAERRQICRALDHRQSASFNDPGERRRSTVDKKTEPSSRPRQPFFFSSKKKKSCKDRVFLLPNAAPSYTKFFVVPR